MKKENHMITLTRLNLTLATAALALTTACAGTGGPNDNRMTGQGAAIGAGPGSLGPVNLPIPCVVDRSVALMSDFGAGASSARSARACAQRTGTRA